MKHPLFILLLTLFATSLHTFADFAQEALAARESYNKNVKLLEQERKERLAPLKPNDWAKRSRINRNINLRRIEAFQKLFEKYPLETDWLLRDVNFSAWLKNPQTAYAELDAVKRIARQANINIAADLKHLNPNAPGSADWLNLLVKLARQRRILRIKYLAQKTPQMVFIRRTPVNPSFFAYTEALSDAQQERFFRPGTELVMLECKPDGTLNERVLIRDEKGMMRDPDISFDASKILFSWKKDDRKDDYHLYEYDLKTRKTRQITFGLGIADFEGIYVNENDIIFSSTRPTQTVDCYWTEVSNLYTCNTKGQFIRRLGFDQVHTVYPQLLNDGSVIYTRWDYNDRGQVFTQALFRMNPDGTAQTEFYGNNSWFPTTPCHARPIPNSQKVLAVAMGHHTWQAGKLILIDPTKGRQEAEGVEYVAPKRQTKPVRIDSFGQGGDLFRHPFPIDEDNYLCSFIPGFLNTGDRNNQVKFGLYYIDKDGNRELLSYSNWKAANHVRPILKRNIPHQRPSIVDFRKNDASFYLHDVYFGPGLKGVKRGDVKSIRVVALDYRAAGVHSNSSKGPAGSALISTPISIDNGSWDVKKVLGTTPVHPDGSAFFKVPARTPVYFQCLDEHGQAIQTMRSWSTLQPGELFSCIGCHEHKNETAIPPRQRSIAAAKGPQPLIPAKPSQQQGFSYLKEVQPIWNKHCIKCHIDNDPTSFTPVPTASFCPRYDTVGAMVDNKIPKNSDDHSIRRFTWHPKSGAQWAQLSFPKPRKIGFTRVYWFDDKPRNGRCHHPQSWKLLYRTAKDAPWQEVKTNDPFSVDVDRFIEINFPPVVMSDLRIEVVLQPKLSGGILEWQVAESKETFLNQPEKEPVLDLSDRIEPAPHAGRNWTRSYVNLTQYGKINPIVNWISSQSVPTMLPPRAAGAVKSNLMTMLKNGHQGVRLSEEELQTVALWIDLLCVFCGDYREANSWNDHNKKKYDHFERKRFRLQAIERSHLEAFIKHQTGKPFSFPVTYSNLAVNPFALSDPTSFPQATSNSECRNERAFKAANVIDGRTENIGHGNNYPSWGPDRIDDPWLKIDFGKQVTIDTIDVWLRAHFPHDDAWSSAVIEFSDGSKLPVTFKKTHERQSFAFPAKNVTWFRFTDFQPKTPKAWRAITEVEAWGSRQ